jgi:hypothetical protein
MLSIDKGMHEAATAPLLCAGISTFEPMKVRFIMRRPEAFFSFELNCLWFQTSSFFLLK